MSSVHTKSRRMVRVGMVTQQEALTMSFLVSLAVSINSSSTLSSNLPLQTNTLIEINV